MACIDSNSLCSMFLPVSPCMTLTKYASRVPFDNSTSIRLVLAQKLTPCCSVEVTRHPSGNAFLYVKNRLEEQGEGMLTLGHARVDLKSAPIFRVHCNAVQVVELRTKSKVLPNKAMKDLVS